MKMRNCLFLLRANYRCHVCHRKQLVVALGTSDLYDGDYGWLPTSEAKPQFILSEVYSMPPELIELVRATGVIYVQRKNAAGDDTYFANCCINCGALFGDSYLAGRPNGPFFLETIKAGKAIELVEIPLASELEIDCNYSRSYSELIRPDARDFRSSRRSKVSHLDDSQW